MGFRFSKTANQYIFYELVPSFLMGLVVFILIILMFQALRYTEFVLIHGVGLGAVFKILTYIVISTLPVLLPMSLLFSVLMTYGKLSADSELLAFKASGISLLSISFPAFLLSGFVFFVSAQTSFNIAPWGNRQFEVLITRLSQTKAGASIRAGAFSEGFFDMVIYASEVDSNRGRLKKIFIYDEKKGDTPLTIIAKSGELVVDPERPGHSALLRLESGDIHRKSVNHTKIKFDRFDISLLDPVQETDREKSLPSLSMEEIQLRLQESSKNSQMNSSLQIELHKRWALSFACLIFGFLAVGVGSTTNKREQKSSDFVICVGVVILYWIFYVMGESLARSALMPIALSIWLPNFIFACLGTYFFKKNWG
jgi:lipopolysaccharide export system permease protein